MTVQQEVSYDKADVAPRPSRNIGVELGAAVVALGMFFSLFLPWTTVAGTGNGLGEYAAPFPSAVAWVTLALGLAISIVAVASHIFGARRSFAAYTFGAAIFGVGALVYYVSTVLPNLVASGCQDNAGTLCAVTPGSPTVSVAPAAGFVVALVFAGIGIIVGAVGIRAVRRSEPQAAE